MRKEDSGILKWGIVATLALALLKLTQIIDWEWVWVVCPLWLPIMVLVAFYLWESIGR